MPRPRGSRTREAQRQAKRRARNKKIILVGVPSTILVLAILVGAALYVALKPPTIADAIQNPELRQEYINSKTKDRPPYIRKVEYLTEAPEEVRKHYNFAVDNVAMFTYPPMLLTPSIANDVIYDQNTHERVSDVFVFPEAFDLSKWGYALTNERFERTFLSALDHEYRHGMQGKDQKVLLWSSDKFRTTDGHLNTKLAGVVVEVDAYLFQLNQDKNLDPLVIGWNRREALRNYASIWDFEGGMDPSFIESLKVELFAGWMLQVVQPRYHSGNGRVFMRNPLVLQPTSWNGKDQLYIQNLETGENYYFTPQEALLIAKRWLK